MAKINSPQRHKDTEKNMAMFLIMVDLKYPFSLLWGQPPLAPPEEGNLIY
jgi:hypothetical protein